jgi:hypothetical protein
MTASPKDVKNYLEACGWIYEEEAKRYYNEERNQRMDARTVEAIIKDSETTLDAIHRLDWAIDKTEPAGLRSSGSC